MKKQTIAIHTPYDRPDAYGALALPVYNNVAFEFQDAQTMSDAFCNRIKVPDYARMTNPTVTNFESLQFGYGRHQQCFSGSKLTG